MLPTFYIVGAARSATDALYSYLRQHPAIYMSPVKETNFFVFYGRPVDYCGPGDQQALRSCYVPTLAQYEALFAGSGDARARGEASPWYLYMPDVPARIRQHTPHAKLIAILRTPIDRAFSSFSMLQRDNREPQANFLSAVALEPQRIAANWEPIWHYQRMGLYYEQIRRYRATFAPDQLRVYLYDDLDRDPAATIADIFGFLDVDTSFTPDLSRRPNQGYVPRSRRVHALVAGDSRLKTTVKPLLPARLRQRLKASLLAQNAGTTTVDRATRRTLLPAFRENILRLEELIHRDLSGWLEAG